MATEKQLRFFVSLCEELGLPGDEEDVKRFLKLDVREASAKIDELLAQRAGQRAMSGASEEPE